jgi:MOSC domain-containing protein YiiM
VTQPRQPCFKLAMKLDRGDMLTLFRASGRSGFYLKVVDAGAFAAEDRIDLVRKSGHGVTISDVNRLRRNPDQPELLHRVLAVPELSESQRGHFENIQSKSVAG